MRTEAGEGAELVGLQGPGVPVRGEVLPLVLGGEAAATALARRRTHALLPRDPGWGIFIRVPSELWLRTGHRWWLLSRDAGGAWPSVLSAAAECRALLLLLLQL